MEAVSLTIVETIYKGKIRPYGKAKGSLTEAPIAKELFEDLVAWRQVGQQQYDKKKQKRGKKKDEHGLPPSDPEAFVFPNRDGSFMDPSNYRKRVLHKLATELGLPKLRSRSSAARSRTVKDVEGVMRHSRVATTTDVYMQESPEGVRAPVDSLHRELQGTMKKLAAKGKVRPPAIPAPAAMVN